MKTRSQRTHTAGEPAYLVKELDGSGYGTGFSEVVEPFKWQFGVPWGTESVWRRQEHHKQRDVIDFTDTDTWGSHIEY